MCFFFLCVCGVRACEASEAAAKEEENKAYFSGGDYEAKVLILPSPSPTPTASMEL
jgi:hypothetical protein